MLAAQQQEPEQAIRAVAGERQAPVIVPDPPDRYPELKNRTLSMVGTVYRSNAAQALAALEVLRDGGAVVPAPVDLLAEALVKTVLPGRGERLDDLLLDGAHTPESIAHVVATLEETPVVAILGVVSGKDLAGIVRELGRAVSRVIVSRPGTFKPGDPQVVFEAVVAAGIPAELEPEPLQALNRARQVNATLAEGRRSILVTGSFYMVAEVRREALACH